MSLWDENNATIETKSWVRSWRQEFYTDLGTDFRFTAHLERVTTLANESAILGKTQLGNVSISASEAATDPELGPLAAALQTTLMTLIEKLRSRAEASTNASI